MTKVLEFKLLALPGCNFVPSLPTSTPRKTQSPSYRLGGLRCSRMESRGNEFPGAESVVCCALEPPGALVRDVECLAALDLTRLFRGPRAKRRHDAEAASSCRAGEIMTPGPCLLCLQCARLSQSVLRFVIATSVLRLHAHTGVQGNHAIVIICQRC